MVESLGMGNADPNTDSQLHKPSTVKASKEMLQPSQSTTN